MRFEFHWLSSMETPDIIWANFDVEYIPTLRFEVGNVLDRHAERIKAEANRIANVERGRFSNRAYIDLIDVVVEDDLENILSLSIVDQLDDRLEGDFPLQSNDRGSMAFEEFTESTGTPGDADERGLPGSTRTAVDLNLGEWANDLWTEIAALFAGSVP